MIKVFAPTDKVFDSNGDVVIHPLKAKVHKEDNGDYYLDLVTGLDCSSYLVEGNIIVVNTPQGDEPFRVTNPQKSGTKITVKAWHIYYDSENYVIPDSYVVEKNCADALNHLNDATEPWSPFTMASDVTTVNSFRCVRNSLYTAIQTVLDRWGGHLVREGFNISIQRQIGQDNGVTVEYRKNLKDISCIESWDDVVTKLLPVGKDGILLNYLDQSADIYIESSVQYKIPYTKSLSFTQDINKEDYETEQAYNEALVADLKSQAESYVAVNCYPKVNYTLKANLERITDVGDTIEVKDKRLGIDMLTNVITFDYDCLLGRYTEIEFGTFRPKLSDFMTEVTDKATANATESATARIDSSLAPVWDVIEDLESQIVSISDYDALSDKPKIEGVTLEGDKTFEELNLTYITNTEIENMMA